MALGVAAALVAIAAAPVGADRSRARSVDPAPASAASLAVASDAVGRAVLARLIGQRARHVGGRVHIDDAAGDGRPWVGVVERRGPALWLVGEGFAVRLAGSLARPRIAGPGYAVWVTGARTGDVLRVRRLGVLRPPAR